MSIVQVSPRTEQVSEPTGIESSDDLTPRGHIPVLDAVRGLAILAVTLYRFRPAPEVASSFGALGMPLLNLGSRGVDLFFVLSGFLITGILYDTKDEPHFFRNFYARRVLRVFPLYYMTLFVAFFILPSLWPGESPFAQAESVQSWLWLYGANLLISWRAAWCLGAFDHFWSLAVEEHFYIVWPLVIFYFSRRTAIRIAATVAVASALGRVLWLLGHGNDAAADVFTLFRLDGLLVGAWLALVARGSGGMRRLTRFAKPIALVSGLLLVPEILSQRRLFTLPTAIYAVFFGALLIVAITSRPTTWGGRFWNSRFLRMLGKYSYGMYVFQNPLIPLLGLWFTVESLERILGSPILAASAYIALMSGATLLVAMLSWHCFERHFLKLKVYF